MTVDETPSTTTNIAIDALMSCFSEHFKTRTLAREFLEARPTAPGYLRVTPEMLLQISRWVQKREIDYPDPPQPEARNERTFTAAEVRRFNWALVIAGLFLITWLYAHAPFLQAKLFGPLSTLIGACHS